MRSFKAFAAASLLLLASLPSFAQKYENGVVEKSVAVIGSDVIMLSDIESEAQMMRMRGVSTDRKARCEILENLLVNKLFYVQAKLGSLVVNDANVEMALSGRIDEAVASLGGEKEVEEYFGKPLYKLRQEWRETLSEQSLIQDMQQQVTSKIPRLTPSDVEEYSKSLPEEDLPIISTKYRIRQVGLYD